MSNQTNPLESTMTVAESLEHREKLAQYMWTGFILMFFVIQAVIWTVAISFTINDPSHVVIANYDEKSLNWDTTQAEIHASDALHWEHQLVVTPTGDIDGNQTVKLSVQDQKGEPVDGAMVELTAFHRGRAAEVFSVSMFRKEAGEYEGVIQVRHRGLWQFSGVVEIAGKKFLFEDRLTLTLPKR